MTQTSTFKVNDYLIDSEEIYVVYKVDDTHIHYKPALTKSRYQSITGSIPIKNVLSSCFRPLLPAKEIDNFLEKLAIPAPGSELLDLKTFKELLLQNNPYVTIPLLQQLWVMKADTTANFSATNRYLLDSILNHLAYEFSFVKKVKPETMLKNLTASLTTALKKSH